MTVGMDLGDKHSCYCLLRSDGQVQREAQVATSKKALREVFWADGAHAGGDRGGDAFPWVSRRLESLGHEVIVANPRQVKLITESSRKNDRVDAQTLARLARIDPELLRPIRHRGEKAQADLMKIRVRATLVEARTGLVNAARGLAKSVGERLPSCDADQMGEEQAESLPEKIKTMDGELEQIARKEYPETKLLQQVCGVGVLIALTFALTIEDKARFRRSRDVGCYLGLRPRRSDSGASQPQLPISKEGDPYLRTLLVQGAHYILGHHGPDTDLKRWGLQLAERGGKRTKKKAVVAVARKLAVLLHRLWATGEVYEPLHNAKMRERRKQAAA